MRQDKKMLSASKHVFGGTAPGGPQLWNASPDHYTGFSCLNMPGSVTIQALATCPYCHVVLTWIHCGLCWPSVAGWGGVCHDMPGFFHQGDGGAGSFCCGKPGIHHGTSGHIMANLVCCNTPDPDATHPVIICGVLS